MANLTIKEQIKQYVREILSEQDDIETPGVKHAQKQVELDKQKVERERQKGIDDKLRTTKEKASTVIDPTDKKIVDLQAKKLKDMKVASQASVNASKAVASAIK